MKHEPHDCPICKEPVTVGYWITPMVTCGECYSGEPTDLNGWGRTSAEAVEAWNANVEQWIDENPCGTCGGEGFTESGPHCTSNCDWCGGCYREHACLDCGVDCDD
jgi:hypothetical protein